MTEGAARFLALMLLATLAASGAAAQERVGVAGAVNPRSLFDRPTGQATIVIGDNVLFEDRIITSAEGLVQVLFVDGSTFTVGPAARVVIDEFVFDPATSSGSLVAEVTSGALRFVGGKLSKGGEEVRFRTPGGTLGVRGGIITIDLDPSCLEDGRCPTATASFVFGRDLTLVLRSGRRLRISTPGYSFVLFGDLANPQVETVPTDLLDLSALQARLAGRPGTSGGSRVIPTPGQVAQSGVPDINSERAPFVVLPRPKPIVVTSRFSPDPARPEVTVAQNVLTETVVESAEQDVTREAVSDDEPPVPPEPPEPEPPEPPEPEPPEPPAGVGEGIAGFATPETFTSADGRRVSAPGEVGIVTALDLAPFGAQLVEEDGTVTGLRIGRDTLPFPAALGETEIAPFVSQTPGLTFGGRGRGTVVRGPGDFAFYYLQEDLPGAEGADEVLYLLTGEPTAPDVVVPAGTGASLAVRSYALSDDFQKRNRGIRSELRHLNPIIAREFGQSLAAAVETPFMIASGAAAGGVARTLYAGLLIDGTGAEQRSAVNLDAGFVSAADGGLALVGRRRGTYRLKAGGAASAMTGPTGTLSAVGDGEFASLYGEDGDSFVYTSGIEVRPESEGDATAFLDRQRTGGILETPDELLSATTTVARLSGTSGARDLTRSSRTITGFAAGLMETSANAVRVYRSPDVGDFTLSFDAGESTVGGVIGVTDVNDEDPAVRSYRLAFGTDIFGGEASTVRSTYVDDDNFGAVATGPTNEPGSPQTLLVTDEGVTVAHGETTPDTYMVSADAVPQPQLFEAAGVEPCECRFMEWGWWGTALDFEGADLPSERRDFAHLGTFAAGDVTPDVDIPTTGTGEFTGHAVGSVVRQQAGGGSARYIAAGALEVNYDFGERAGELRISRFDGKEFSGTIAGGVASDGVSNQFTGRLSGSGVSGSTDGAFVRGPKGPAEGVLGNFDVKGTGYRAVGNYVGER